MICIWCMCCWSPSTIEFVYVLVVCMFDCVWANTLTFRLYDKRWMRNSTRYSLVFYPQTIFRFTHTHTHPFGIGALLCVKRGVKYLRSNVETIWNEQTKINHPVKYSNSFRLVGHRENNVYIAVSRSIAKHSATRITTESWTKRKLWQIYKALFRSRHFLIYDISNAHGPLFSSVFLQTHEMLGPICGQQSFDPLVKSWPW